MNFSKLQKKKIFDYSALPHHGKRNDMKKSDIKALEDLKEFLIEYCKEKKTELPCSR